MDSIPGPYDSDLIFIEALVDDCVAPANPPLTNPLGLALLRLNPEGSTPDYTFDPSGYLCPPAYSTWTPIIFSFIFSVSLIVEKFTIFGIFSGNELLDSFYGPK